MLMAGGEGGGKLLSTTLALARARLPIDLVVVCGRNEHLAAEARRDVGDAADADASARLHRQDSRVFSRRRSARHQSGPGHAGRSQRRAACRSSSTITFRDRNAATSTSFATTGSAWSRIGGASQVVEAVRTMIRTPERLAAIRHNQEIVAPRRSSRRIAALIAQIANTGTIPPQEFEPLVPLRDAIGV